MSAMERAIQREYQTAVSDNARWAGFVHRRGDIFVCTPAKCGTTWMQTIVASLLWPDGAPASVMQLSPWIDAKFDPVDDVLARLEAQQHRRFIKTHTPADGIPLFGDAQYVVVIRDPRDVFMSWLNHVDHMSKDKMAGLLGIDAAVLPEQMRNPDVHEYFEEWLHEASMLWTLRSWWQLRDEANVTLVHYNDLKTDLDGEMRKLAEWLAIDVPDDAWPRVVDRCTFENMKARSAEIGDFTRLFEGGAETFLFKGTNNRWREVLTEDDLARYDARVSELLPADARAWAEAGSLAVGVRP